MSLERGIREDGERDGEILECINAALTRLGSTMKWVVAPDSLPGFEVLKGKRVAMVDDTLRLIEGFAPAIIVATGGPFEPIHYAGGGVDQLVQRILSSRPDIVLMDYFLADTPTEHLTGVDVARRLFNAEFTGQIIGFSSDGQAMKEFKAAGVPLCVKKVSFHPAETIQRVCRVLRRDDDTPA